MSTCVPMSHASDYHPRMLCHALATTSTQRAAGHAFSSIDDYLYPESSRRPCMPKAIVSTCTPTLYPSDHLHPPTSSHFVPQQLFCDGPLMIISGVSNICHLRLSYVGIQQPSIIAPHTLYRRLSVASSIPDCVSVTVCCSRQEVRLDHSIPGSAREWCGTGFMLTTLFIIIIDTAWFRASRAGSLNIFCVTTARVSTAQRKSDLDVIALTSFRWVILLNTPDT